MRTLWLALLLLASPTPVFADPLTNRDIVTLQSMSEEYVKGWLNNDRHAVMSVFAKDAVFIPHDGVIPRSGYTKIDEFWFPNGKAVGVVPAYTQAITNISGDGRHATMYGRFDLTWQNETKRYNWIGNFLIVARKDRGRWLFTHMMASDEQPKVEPVVKN